MPSSEELHKRRAAAVARGRQPVMLTSYVDHASGGTLTDVDGREWIDFASGIAVTRVGNSAPRVVAAVREQVERFTHTCFMVAPYESYVAVCETLNALTPGDVREALGAVQLRRRGGGERGEDRPARHRAARRWWCSTTPTTAGPT